MTARDEPADRCAGRRRAAAARARTAEPPRRRRPPTGARTTPAGRSATLWLAAAVALAVHAVVTLRRPAPDRMADLQVYIGSVRSLLAGGSLYDFAAWNGAPFTYPPFAGIVFVPVAVVGVDAARLLWLGALAGVLVSLAVVVRRCGRSPAWDAPARLPGVLLVCAVSAPVASNIRFGQVSLVLVLLVLLDEAGVVPARLRGVATGLAAALKLTPAVFVLYWWLTGRRAEAGRAAAAAAAATALAWMVLPGESARY
ncbi:MAG TPA: glycosyltransferase family 87 protein, partial [Pilimelia sp.]|nr:glycosyltransferase family 87 protein [Pilimelia sp.]